MNPVEDDDFSHWGSLADELGLDPLSTPPKPSEAVKPPAKTPEPIAPVQVSHPIVEAEPEPEVESPLAVHHENLDPLSDEGEIPETADTVLDEEELVESESAEADSAEEGEAKGEGEGKGRRRRRRRRKKKGSGEVPVAGSPAETEEVAAPVPSVASKFVEPALEESAVELLDDAPEELLDEEDDKSELTSAMDEELTEEAAQPTPEWKVVSWTELVGSLYRPER